MNARVAIAFNTRNATESAKRVVEASLLQPDKFDLYWFDGSDTQKGIELPLQYPQVKHVLHNVRGSGDAAVVMALTMLLAAEERYTHIGIVEDDVLMQPSWFEQCMALFDVGKQEGYEVGAASARAYEDRILIQRDGFAVMHNLGWGQVIFSRRAAIFTLEHFRTGWTTENRRTFAQICELDIGKRWAFRAAEQWICSDWGNDAALAQHGLASLALTPSPVEMIEQKIPLEQQGLRLAKRPNDMLRDDRHYRAYVNNMRRLSRGEIEINTRPPIFTLDDGGHIYFAHQLRQIGAGWFGEWVLEHNLGFGPFNAKARDVDAQLDIKLAGAIDVLVGASPGGGKCRIRDLVSGYEVEPELPDPKPGMQQFVNVVVPAAVSYRTIRVDRLSPGVIVYGVRTKEAQPLDLGIKFDMAQLFPFPLSEATQVNENLITLDKLRRKV